MEVVTNKLSASITMIHHAQQNWSSRMAKALCWNSTGYGVVSDGNWYFISLDKYMIVYNSLWSPSLLGVFMEIVDTSIALPTMKYDILDVI